MALGVCTGPLRGKPLTAWLEVNFPASKVFSPSLHSYFAIHKDDGYLYAFGNNNAGRLGLGLKHVAGSRNDWIKRPLKTSLQNVVKMVGDSDFVIALTSSGELYGAGNNTSGCLGLGTNSAQEETFTRIDFPNTYLDVAAGLQRVLAVRSDGALFGWGVNSASPYGTFVDPAIPNSNLPIQLGLIAGTASYKTDWRKVYCTNTSSIAIDSSGAAYGRGGGSVLCNGDTAFIGNDRDFDLRCGKTEGTFDPGCGFDIGTSAGAFCTTVISPKWNRADATWSELMCGSESALGYSGGTLYGWGSDASGLFGMGDQHIVSWNSILGIYRMYKNSVGTVVSDAVDPTTGVNNTPHIEEYYGNSNNRWSITEPTVWAQTTKSGTQYLGRYDWFDKVSSVSPYTIPITLGTYTASNTLIPVGTIKCSGYATIFLTSNRLYACGNLSNFNGKSPVFNATDLILTPFLSALQGSITEFDIDRISNSGIFRTGNDVYIFGQLGFQNKIIGGIEIGKPIKYIIKNPDPSFNPIKPVKP